jgi:hypothetical protein
MTGDRRAQFLAALTYIWPASPSLAFDWMLAQIQLEALP